MLLVSPNMSSEQRVKSVKDTVNVLPSPFGQNNGPASRCPSPDASTAPAAIPSPSALAPLLGYYQFYPHTPHFYSYYPAKLAPIQTAYPYPQYSSLLSSYSRVLCISVLFPDLVKDEGLTSANTQRRHAACRDFENDNVHARCQCRVNASISARCNGQRPAALNLACALLYLVRFLNVDSEGLEILLAENARVVLLLACTFLSGDQARERIKVELGTLSLVEPLAELILFLMQALGSNTQSPRPP
ncbi:hypothetical protein B0H14DRAFT_3860229 [Mycena olivaceomarginata]|nr:hypothetical protein B0H14DRAFT_3860229 [Mycena olivaceomarginata]